MGEAELRVVLDAVIVAVTDEAPRVLIVDSPSGGAGLLPSGPFATADATLELALRRFVSTQAGLDVGYVEQLYTFGDLGRRSDSGVRELSVAYLALVRESVPATGAAFVDWYELFPWEDHRRGQPSVIDGDVVPVLERWICAAPTAASGAIRQERAQIAFGLDGSEWDGVRVLERYELLWEVGLLEESPKRTEVATLGTPLAADHRRIVATAIERLRGKLSYRPVVFELLADRFTLLQLQRLVEALAGASVHKQNFRRMVESAGLVEGTGGQAPTGGRPAELFRFRREVIRERPRPGVGTPWR